VPIVDIEIVLMANEAIREETVSELAHELGEVFYSSPGRTWIKVHPLLAHQYAENGGRSEGVYPVFVTIMKSDLPLLEEMQKEVAKITAAVAQIYGRPAENVHVIYQPEARGRVAFGGEIIS
jgi:phenylpyruvate tautomerase PptA (4-oxalocrotonate tautomerase family)